jgi:hypothetical protein
MSPRILEFGSGSTRRLAKQVAMFFDGICLMMFPRWSLAMRERQERVM